MSGLIVFVWFVCGIAGVHIGYAYDSARGIPFDREASMWIWASFLGPILLLTGVIICVEQALKAVPHPDRSETK